VSLAAQRTAPASDLLAELSQFDALLATRGIARTTLDPRRTRATSLEDLGTRLWRPAPVPVAASLRPVLVRGLLRIADAIQRNFPDNLFWDLDQLFSSLVGRAQSHRAPGSSAALARAERDVRQMAFRVVELQDLFGRQTRIRFRYVHDFLYGYDWAKWVKKDEAARSGVGPYDAPFLDALYTRGLELLELIDANDLTYPPLPEGVPRNPFGFSREPESEEVLHRELARAALVPVEAWRGDGTARWEPDFTRLRAERAVSLGLSDA
jgi:hypothetical protein